MNIEELLKEENTWLNIGNNFTLLTAVSKMVVDRHYFINCSVQYNPNEKKWDYAFKNSDVFDLPGFEDAIGKTKAFLEKETKKYQTNWAQKAEALFSSLSFLYDYELKNSPNLNGKKVVMIKNATLNNFYKATLDLYLNDENKLTLVEVTFYEEINPGTFISTGTFSFTWDYAKEYFPGLKEFEEFLYKKSKDRLALLF